MSFVFGQLEIGGFHLLQKSTLWETISGF
ncbi:hypothetical protein LINPERPRIM_LOCUS35431 [Linum perenne]